MSKTKKGFILVLAVVIVLSLPLIAVMYKPSIHNTDDLTHIHGIGEVLSDRVVKYVDLHPSCDIDDLRDVQGIGEIKLKLIKGEYR